MMSLSVTDISYDEIYDQIKKLLPQGTGEIKDTDNLIESGLDSLHIMRLVSQWRKSGYNITFAELIEHPTLQQWQTLLLKSFSEISSVTSSATAIDQVKNEPFPLTDVQYAYWIGRDDNRELGGVACHAYLEIDGHLNHPEQLNLAFSQLIQHHPMLRASFTDNGQQQIKAANNNAPLIVHDLRELTAEQCTQRLAEIRKRLSHRKLAIEHSQVIGLELSLLANSKSRLHFDIDLLVADVQSLNIILRDLAQLYRQELPLKAPNDWNFAHYLAKEQQRKQANYQTSKNYWNQRLTELPVGPQLPILSKQITKPEFTRRTFVLNHNQWQNIKQQAAKHKITSAMTLACAYGYVLARWSNHTNFLLNIPLFDRNVEELDIEHVVADFTNLLLDCDYSQSQSFAEQAIQLQQQFHKNVAYSTYSAIEIQREMARFNNQQGIIAPVVFACNLGTPLLDMATSQTLGELHYMISQTPQVWLDHQLYQLEGGLLLSWDAVEDLFPEGLLDQMFNSYIQLLNQFIEQDWQQPIVTLLPTAQQLIRKQVNTVTAPLPSTTLIEPIFAYAKANPTSIALIYNEQGISYKELTTQALKIASLLVSKGLKTGEPVAVSLPRGPMQIMAVLGVLAAGGAYVPVSTTQPTSRQQKIFNTAEIRLVLCNQPLFEDSQFEFISPLLAMDLEPLAEPVKVDNKSLAYIIFTSGSTGEPKGVEISHQAALNTIVDICQRYHIDNSSCALAVSSLDFDLSVFDIFGLLGVGGRLVLISDEERRDAASWLQLIFEHDVCVWNSVPILLDMLLVVATHDTRTLPLKTVLISGDWIGLDLPVRLAQCCGKLPKLVAMGGATEGSIWSNAFDVTLPLPEQWSSIPYGYPLTNQCYRVVDALGRDCPDYVAGELWIGGAGVALGYRGAPELTAERFVELNGMRWYRTGDRGRYWPDGTLEFLGRQDHQVKVRGHRIELGEIESALAGLPEIARAVAVTVGMPPQLAAAIQLKQGVNTTEHDIKQLLQQLLPDYMVPTSLVIYQALPLNANGKVDRKTIISELATHTTNVVDKEPPRDELERQLAELWQEVLKCPALSRNDDFFLSGGDSLTATQIIQLLHKRHITSELIPLRALFTAPTVASLSDYIKQQWQTHSSIAINESTLFEEGTL